MRIDENEVKQILRNPVIFSIRGGADPMYIQTPPDFEAALEIAIDAIDRGDLELGNGILEWVLKYEPSNRIALLWMACTVPDENLKRRYYRMIPR
jgi:hypothetical protein